MVDRNHSFIVVRIEDFKKKYRHFGPLVMGAAAPLYTAINNEESFRKLVWATEDLDLPAIAGIVKLCAEIILAAPPELHDQLKKCAGAIVCAVMEANGYQKTGVKKAVPPVPVRVFKVAEVYESVEKAKARKTAA
jgi:hypothetical protein